MNNSKWIRDVGLLATITYIVLAAYDPRVRSSLCLIRPFQDGTNLLFVIPPAIVAFGLIWCGKSAWALAIGCWLSVLGFLTLLLGLLEGVTFSFVVFYLAGFSIFSTHLLAVYRGPGIGPGPAQARIAQSFGAVCVVGLLALIIRAPSSAGAEQDMLVSDTHTCAGNLRKISMAKDQYILDRGGTAPQVFSDLVPVYIPADCSCPVGGEYVLKAPGEDPECSVEWHGVDADLIHSRPLISLEEAYAAAAKVMKPENGKVYCTGVSLSRNEGGDKTRAIWNLAFNSEGGPPVVVSVDSKGVATVGASLTTAELQRMMVGIASGAAKVEDVEGWYGYGYGVGGWDRFRRTGMAGGANIEGLMEEIQRRGTRLDPSSLSYQACVDGYMTGYRGLPARYPIRDKMPTY